MIFFTSDLHFGHNNIIDYCNRPFSGENRVDEMNEALIDNWNSVVQPYDTVYILGDFAMGKIDESLNLALQLNGYKMLVPGNHDRCWSRAKKVDYWIDRYEAVGLNVINGYIPDWTDDRGIVVADLCHFPFEGDSGGFDRYVDMRPENHGQWIIHGHIHDEWLVRDRMINVGVDVWDYRPITIHMIREIMND